MSDPLDDPRYLRGEARRLQDIIEAVADPVIKAELAAHSLHLEQRAAALDDPERDAAALQLNIEDLASSVLTAAYQAEGEFGLTMQSARGRSAAARRGSRLSRRHPFRCSCRRGISSTKLHGRKRLSSW